MMKNGNISILISVLIILFLCSVVSADELRVPLSCWPKELQAEFKAVGLKLDLNSIDRTDDSWGYVVNKGSEFVLFTYHSATKEDFNAIQKIVFKIELEKRTQNE